MVTVMMLRMAKLIITMMPAVVSLTSSQTSNRPAVCGLAMYDVVGVENCESESQNSFRILSNIKEEIENVRMYRPEEEISIFRSCPPSEYSCLGELPL